MPHESLAREAGPLEAAQPSQPGRLVAEYFANADGLEPDYRFAGIRCLGMIDTAAYRLGVILLLAPADAPRGTIVALHGYNAYSAFNLSALYRLAEDGWAVLAVDLPGHGCSGGERGDIRDFSEYAVCLADVIAWIQA